jgi:hypothetical protein
VLISPLLRKFKRYFRYGLKKFHTINKGSNFLIELAVEMNVQILKIAIGKLA